MKQFNRMGIWALVLCFILLFPIGVLSYGAWDPEADGLMELTEAIDNLEAAIQKATSANAAHPAFLSDLRRLHSELLAAKNLVAQQIVPQFSYGSYESSLSDVSGEWDVTANNHRSRLVVFQDGSTITGTIFGSPLADGQVFPDGTVYFIRTGSNQVYTGILEKDSTNKDVIKGTFDCPVTRGTFNWVAIRR